MNVYGTKLMELVQSFSTICRYDSMSSLVLISCKDPAYYQ